MPAGDDLNDAATLTLALVGIAMDIRFDANTKSVAVIISVTIQNLVLKTVIERTKLVK